MNASPKRLILFVLVSMAIIFAYTQIDNYINPKPKAFTLEEKFRVREGVSIIATAGNTGGIGDTARLLVDAQVQHAPAEFREMAKTQVEEKRAAQAAKPVVVPKPQFEEQIVNLGGSGSQLQVRLTNRGAGVHRVVVTNFEHANERGLKSRDHLHLVREPGDRTADETAMNGTSAQAAHEDALPSFLLYHYANPNDLRPSNLLGEREWTIVSRPQADSESQVAVFQTDLTEHGVRITKTYSLKPGEYHVGLALKIEKLPGSTPQPFRYSLSSGHALPIEGVWYTSTYRNSYIGWVDNARRSPRRHMDDAASIHHNSGGEKMVRSDTTFQYAAVAGQFFASAVCVDDEQPRQDFIEFVRATAEGSYPKEKPMLGDITVRMISEAMTVEEQKPVEHRFLLYHGPLKVRLLSQLRGAQAVAPELVERYETKLNLRTLTDYQSQGPIGTFANFIFWTDLTIATTNFMHWLLGLLMQVFPGWLAILLLTVMVRGALHPLSRRQQLSMMKLQDKMAKLQPELKKLEEQFIGKDPQEFQQAKMKFMMEKGVNPMSQLGGCLLMFAQMPIFMGLYYCLQESVFFRLESFLWMPNLAAPDMLAWWTEKIPFISAPDGLGSTFYLGPYFNILPVVAALFMYVQQRYLTPPPTDEQQRMQQSMFKYMIIVMGFVFYKTAAGLCMYFIASSLWGLAERKLIPKPKLKDDGPDSPKGGKAKVKKVEPAGPKSWLQRKREELAETWKKILDAAEKKR